MDMESPTMATKSAPGDYEAARGTKFKFKSKSKTKRHRENETDSKSHRNSKRRRSETPEEWKDSVPRSHHNKTSRKKYHEDLNDDPAAYDDTYSNNARSANYMDPDAAFRESLFDAMADDEGAAFWEGVYGQPIHVYPNHEKEGPQGELEQMNDEEYAEYVRGRMWEKTHQHVMEERARREERRKQTKAEDEAWEKEEGAREEAREKERKEQRRFESKIEASLRRGEERKSQKRWQDAWSRYLSSWDHFTEVLATKSKEEGSIAGKAARGIIPWPVESGKWKHAEKEDVEDFFAKAVPAAENKMAIMKVERVRWHPDKMQQRFGANKLDEETVRTVTAVFQVVDRLWGELREKK